MKNTMANSCSIADILTNFLAISIMKLLEYFISFLAWRLELILHRVAKLHFKKGIFAPPSPPNERQEGHLLSSVPFPAILGNLHVPENFNSSRFHNFREACSRIHLADITLCYLRDIKPFYHWIIHHHSYHHHIVFTVIFYNSFLHKRWEGAVVKIQNIV